MTAVLLLIFKDTLLGFVAGIQLIENRMVAPGDWVEMEKYGADGEVVGITLNTVKIQNWDKTITTIPTYALINESFKKTGEACLFPEGEESNGLFTLICIV